MTTTGHKRGRPSGLVWLALAGALAAVGVPPIPVWLLGAVALMLAVDQLDGA